MTPQEQREAALAQIRGVYEDSEAEINGRVYKFHKMTHVDRRKVFAFQSSVQQQMSSGNFAFLDTPVFAQVEEVMWKNISFEGATISKLREHWEEYPEDYMQLVSVAMGVMSYPFIRAAGIASASQGEKDLTISSSKPM
jgi:hypothetical protein